MTEKTVILEDGKWYTVTWLPAGAISKTRTERLKYAGWNSTFNSHQFYKNGGIHSLMDEQIKLVSETRESDPED